MTDRFDVSHPDLAHLLRWVQHGVVARRQLRELGAGPKDIERMLRRRELAKVSPGVYVNHTGPLTRQQREWAAVQATWPAALTRETALPLDDRGVIHLAIHSDRTVQPPPRCVLHRTERLDDWVDWRAGPPQVATEQALIDVMSARVTSDDVPGAFGALAEVAHTRLTSPATLLGALGDRSRVAGRSILTGLIRDLEEGACSVLERGYLHRVERAHALPRGRRQIASRATGKGTVRDIHYEEYGVIVEPDGRAFHDNPKARDNDARRDIAELATSDLTSVRVTYGLVFGDECRLAVWIGTILRRHGWTGCVRGCPKCRGGAA